MGLLIYELEGRKQIIKNSYPYRNVYIADIRECIQHAVMQRDSHLYELGLNLNIKNKDKRNFFAHYFFSVIYFLNKNKDREVIFFSEANTNNTDHKIAVEIVKAFGFSCIDKQYAYDIFTEQILQNEAEVHIDIERAQALKKPKSIKKIKRLIQKYSLAHFSSFLDVPSNKISVLK